MLQSDKIHKKDCLNLYSEVFWCADFENETHFLLAQLEQGYILDIFHEIWIYLLYKQYTSIDTVRKLLTSLQQPLGNSNNNQQFHIAVPMQIFTIIRCLDGMVSHISMFIWPKILLNVIYFMVVSQLQSNLSAQSIILVTYCDTPMILDVCGLLL